MAKKKKGKKPILRPNGIRKLLKEGGEDLAEDERALLMAFLSIDAESGAGLDEEEQAALDALVAKMKGYDAEELAQAAKQMVTAKTQKERKLEWSELDQVLGKEG